MAGPKRTPNQRIHDRALISEWMRRRMSERQMRDKLNARYQELWDDDKSICDKEGNPLSFTQGQIHYDIKAVRRELIKEQITNADAARAQVLAELDEVIREAYRGWAASITKKRTETWRQRGQGDAQGGDLNRERVVKDETQDGNRAYLEIIREAILDRAKLLGLTNPEEIKHSGAITMLTQVIEGVPEDAI